MQCKQHGTHTYIRACRPQFESKMGQLPLHLEWFSTMSAACAREPTQIKCGAVKHEHMPSLSCIFVMMVQTCGNAALHFLICHAIHVLLNFAFHVKLTLFLLFAFCFCLLTM